MFYIEEEDRIVLFDEKREILERTLEHMPQYKDLKIKQTSRPIKHHMFADTEEYKEFLINKNEAYLNENFFKTSLGYIKRKIVTKEGELKDFLIDLLPSIIASFRTTQSVSIPIYQEFDLTQEINDWMQYRKIVPINQTFIDECSNLLSEQLMQL